MNKPTDQRMLALTKEELAWLTQEVERRLTIMDSLLGGLTEYEYRKTKAQVIEECLATFEVGSEVTRERKALSETGIISTMGYDKFQDGILLSLMLSRVSDARYSLDLDLDLEVSAFDETDTSTIPAKSTSVLRSPGMLIRDGGVVYAGSLKRRDAGKVFGVFSLDASRGSDLLTIWVRCREIR